MAMISSKTSSRSPVQQSSGSLWRVMEARAASNAIFLDWADESYSYRSFAEDVRACCALFHERRVPRGGRIVIQTQKERIATSVFVAALLDGHVPVMLTPETPGPRLRAIVQLTKPDLLIIDRSSCGDDDWLSSCPLVKVSETGQRAKGVLHRFRAAEPEAGTFEHLIRAAGHRQPSCQSVSEDLAYILFTSGTTSAPKGVMITHRNLFTHLGTLSRVFAYDHASAIFNSMVLAHGDGLVQGPLLTLANGCRLIRAPAASPTTLESHLNLVRAKRATHFITVPTVYGFICRYAQHDDYFDAEEFTALVSVAAKLDENVWRQLEQRFKRPVYNMYGLTETVASALYAGPGADLGPIGTIGKPIDIEMRLVRVDGSLAPQGEPGEIWLRGDNVSPGYFGMPSETAEKYEKDWLKTGDLAILRPDGSYEIVGRIKTMIMSGGFLINPEEIEEALRSHPAVAEVACIGLPDADFGEVAIAAVVLDHTADEPELTAHCSRLLEPQKVPKRIFVLASIPRGDAGKPQVEQLRKILSAGLSEKYSADDGSTLASAVLQIASRTFRMPVGALSLDSSPHTVPRWDSFAHINLIVNSESHFGIRIPNAVAVKIDNLGKLAAALDSAG